MKLIERLALEHGEDRERQVGCEGCEKQAAQCGFEAGFRKAREMASNAARQFATEKLATALLTLGEEDAEGLDHLWKAPAKH